MTALADRPLSHLLVAVDGSMGSARAARLAIELSVDRPEAKITFCHVLDVPLMVARATDRVDDYALAFRTARDAARRMLEEYCLEAKEHGVNAQRCVRYGRPASEISTFAQLIHADLVVIGNHHASALRRFFRGSTRDELMRSSPIPVLVAERAVR